MIYFFALVLASVNVELNQFTREINFNEGHISLQSLVFTIALRLVDSTVSWSPRSLVVVTQIGDCHGRPSMLSYSSQEAKFHAHNKG